MNLYPTVEAIVDEMPPEAFSRVSCGPFVVAHAFADSWQAQEVFVRALQGSASGRLDCGCVGCEASAAQGLRVVDALVEVLTR